MPSLQGRYHVREPRCVHARRAAASRKHGKHKKVRTITLPGAIRAILHLPQVVPIRDGDEDAARELAKEWEGCTLSGRQHLTGLTAAREEDHMEWTSPLSGATRWMYKNHRVHTYTKAVEGRERAHIALSDVNGNIITIPNPVATIEEASVILDTLTANGCFNCTNCVDPTLTEKHFFIEDEPLPQPLSPSSNPPSYTKQRSIYLQHHNPQPDHYDMVVSFPGFDHPLAGKSSPGYLLRQRQYQYEPFTYDHEITTEDAKRALDKTPNTNRVAPPNRVLSYASNGITKAKDRDDRGRAAPRKNVDMLHNYAPLGYIRDYTLHTYTTNETIFGTPGGERLAIADHNNNLITLPFAETFENALNLLDSLQNKSNANTINCSSKTTHTELDDFITIQDRPHRRHNLHDAAEYIAEYG